MLVISTAGDLAHALADPPDGLEAILHRYQPLMAEAVVFIIDPGDRESDLSKLRGQPFELWEFILLSDGWYEAVFIISDDGAGHVVLIPDRDDIDPTLLTICREHAVTDV